MQGRRPVGATLKNGEVLRLFGDLRGRLDGGRTGADDADTTIGKNLTKPNILQYVNSTKKLILESFYSHIRLGVDP